MPHPTNRDTSLERLHPAFRERAQAVLNELAAESVPFRVFEAYRSPLRQQYLYEQGRSRTGAIVTYARPWQSYHQYGFAADFVLFENGSWSWNDSGPRARWWERLHAIGRQHGLEALGFEKPHLQLAGLTTADLRAGRFPAGGDGEWAENLEAMIVSWQGSPAAPPLPSVLPVRPTIAAVDSAPLTFEGIPGLARADWHSRNGGREWRCADGGVHRRDHADGDTPLRTAGEPLTCRAIWNACGYHILDASRRHGVAPELIMMVMATETAHLRNYGFTGPLSFRWEEHVRVTDVRPARTGDYSAGPMQTLASTARWIIRTQQLDYDPLAVAPAYERRPAPPDAHPLYEPAVSIDIGTAVIRHRMPVTGDDPILVAAAYNAGGLYPGTGNPWRLRSHGTHLDRAAAWYGDACAVLAPLRKLATPVL